MDEPKKGLVPMTRTGSGLKTILLALLNLYLVPDLMGRHKQKSSSLSNFVFGFEELENNLHPSLQRRLFLYLKQVSESDGCKFFVTTHSHVVIDLFSRDQNAQIIHVMHDGECAKVERVTTYIGHKSIFDDLEVRASDLLQTNCVVWVEGPSDRVYFNKWVELWTAGELKEHVDYEVCFSGGTLLARYSFDDSTEEGERIEALRINRNAVVLIDSDKKTSDDKLKGRVERVGREVEGMGGIAWVTAGKEIENYIPDEALEAFVGRPGVRSEAGFADLFEFIERNGKGNYSGRKVELAEKICQILTKQMMERHLDLGEQMEKICGQIRIWNNREASSRDPMPPFESDAATSRHLGGCPRIRL